MLTETVVSTILQANITGAGLIIAIYALITPIARKIFKERVKLHRKKKKQFDTLKEKVNEESSSKDFKRLKTLSTQIKGLRVFPRYLGIGVLLVFGGYMFTAFFSIMWLINSSRGNSLLESAIELLFALSTLGFAFVGIYAIGDVYVEMKREFEQVKKEKEEVEKNNREIQKVAEQIRKQAEMVKKWEKT
mgnify:CR=1 FL=1